MYDVQVKLVVRVVMVVVAMLVMMIVAVVVVGKRLTTKTNSYIAITTNTINNTTNHAINYS